MLKSAKPDLHPAGAIARGKQPVRRQGCAYKRNGVLRNGCVGGDPAGRDVVIGGPSQLARIGGIFRPQQPIPEGEVQPEMTIAMTVVEAMVGGTNHPASQPMMGKSPGKMVEPEMIHQGPDRHR